MNAPKWKADSAWRGHEMAAWNLVDEVKPRVVVELGVYHGYSYFWFCQCIREQGLDKYGTRAFGVDSWTGDPMTGPLPSNTFAQVTQHNLENYSDFSTLLKMPFDTARGLLNDDIVDILHIDGFHTYDAVRHDFLHWKPKMSKSGVVVFHDIAVETPEFGVKKLWEEWKGIYRHQEFHHSCGLGILYVGDRWA